MKRLTREERLRLYKDILFDINEAAHQIAHDGTWTEQAKALLALVPALKALADRKRWHTDSHGSRSLTDQEEEWNE